MHENSIFIAIIGITTSGPYMGFEHHQCIESHEWWLDIFDKYDMYNIGFTMNASPRSIPAININEIGFILKKKIILWEI